MINADFCVQLGTPNQHEYICFLASAKGYHRLRDAAAEFLGVSVSKMARTTVTVAEASSMIDWLKSLESPNVAASNR